MTLIEFFQSHPMLLQATMVVGIVAAVGLATLSGARGFLRWANVRRRFPGGERRRQLEGGALSSEVGRLYEVASWHGRPIYLRRGPSSVFGWMIPRSQLEVHDLPEWVALRREAWSGSRDDVKTGDHWFDERVHVRGDPLRVRALLGYRERAELLSLVSSGVQLLDGRLVWPVLPTRRSTLRRKGAILCRLRDKLLDQARRPPLDALGWHAREDRVDGVRLACVETLVGLADREEDARRALRDVARSGRGAERLLAAESVGEIRVLGSIAAERRAPAEHRIRALHAVVRVRQRLTADVLRLVDDMLTAPSIRLRTAAIEVLRGPGGRHRLRDVQQLIASAVARPKAPGGWLAQDAEPMAAAARVVGRHGDAGDARLLLQALTVAKEGAWRELLDALARIGTLAHVEAVLDWAEASRPRWAQDRARVTVRAIQARSGDLEAGRLSLASEQDEQGRLTPARDPSGAIELARDAGGE